MSAILYTVAALSVGASVTGPDAADLSPDLLVALCVLLEQ